MPRTRIALICAATVACAFRSSSDNRLKQQRDLKIEKIGGEPTPLPKGGIPRSYAVIVGISRYQNLPEKWQLHFPERDAQSIYTILISPEGGNFKQENVHMLTGAKASLAAMRHEIDDWLPSVAKDGDRVLIYFAGHGFVHEGKGYLAPFDIDPSRVDSTGYPMEELGVAIGSKIQAKSKILFTDACHSGAISPADTENLNGKLATLDKSLFSLTASRASESSFESPGLDGGHGVFTYYVVQGTRRGSRRFARRNCDRRRALRIRSHASARGYQGAAESYFRPHQLRPGYVAGLPSGQCRAGRGSGSRIWLAGVRIEHGRRGSVRG